MRGMMFVWDPGEWATLLASYNRSFDWAGAKAGLGDELLIVMLYLGFCP